MGARLPLRQRIVAAGLTGSGSMGSPTAGPRPCGSHAPPQRRSCAIRCAERAFERRHRCRRGCGSRRGRCAGRRARGRRWRTPRRGSGSVRTRVVVGDRRRRRFEQHGVADLRGGHGLAVGLRPGRGRAASSVERSPARARRLRSCPLSLRCSTRYAVRQCAGRGRRAGSGEQRPSVGERRRGARRPSPRTSARGRCCPRAASTCAPGVHAGAADSSGTWMSVSYAVCLPGRHAVLAEVEAVVGREHDVGVVELPGDPQRVHEAAPTPRSTACSDRMPHAVEVVDRACVSPVLNRGRSRTNRGIAAARRPG